MQPRSASVMQIEPGHLTPNHFARSSSLGGHTRATSNNGNPSSLGQESGFQSCSSLVSLSQQKHSLFRGSPRLNRGCSNGGASSEKAESSISGSMASLASGVIVPSLVSGMMRHSLNGGRPESRISGKEIFFCKQYFCEDILFGGGVLSYSEIIGLCSDFLFFV